MATAAAGSGSKPLVHAVIAAEGQAEKRIFVSSSDVNGIRDEQDQSPFSFGFTGKHDHGDLPSQSANQYTALVQALAVSLRWTELDAGQSTLCTESQNPDRFCHATARCR